MQQPACLSTRKHARRHPSTRALPHSIVLTHAPTHLTPIRVGSSFLPIDYRPFVPSALIGHGILLGGYWHVVSFAVGFRTSRTGVLTDLLGFAGDFRPPATAGTPPPNPNPAAQPG